METVSESVQMSPWIFRRRHTVGHIVGHGPNDECSPSWEMSVTKEEGEEGAKRFMSCTDSSHGTFGVFPELGFFQQTN